MVLDLGCGYGRTLSPFSEKAGFVIGIDTSLSSLALAADVVQNNPRIETVCMDAARLAFPAKTFDKVVCIQNGISAFHVNQLELVHEAVRVTKKDGVVFFSTYSDKFWEHRLEWFRLQAEAGLLGEIDMSKTGNGVIVCKDGFKATTLSPDDFRALISELDVRAKIVEVDKSSLFCEIYI